MKRLIRHIFFAINGILSLFLILATYAPNINPSDNWFFSFFGYFFHFLVVVNLLFAIIWIFTYWRYLFLSIISLLFSYQTIETYYSFGTQESYEGEAIEVLSYNVQHFYSFLNNTDSSNTILEAIKNEKANIICLQETKLQKNGPLNPLKLKRLFPGIKHCQLAHQSTWGGPVTFTSFPIINMGEIRYDSSSNLVIYTDIKRTNDTLRIYNCHLQSFQFQPEEYSYFADSTNNENKSIKKTRSILSKIKLANIKRSAQVDKLAEHIKNCPYPIILCGDFNATPISYTYKTIRDLLNDSFINSGQGISNTYKGNFPSYRIDYIFYSDDFNSYNYKRLNHDYSDHFAIRSSIVKTTD